MENQNQKWVNLSFVTAAALFAYVAFLLLFRVAGIYDLEARIQDIDLWIRGVSVMLGALLFLALYLNDRVNQFMHEVVAELSRVTWPMPKDTLKTTVVVVIMVIISGLLLGGLDALWTWTLKILL